MKYNYIYCEDCTQTMSRMDDNSVDLIITSPPFNVNKDYGVYLDARDDYDQWITEVCKEMERVAKIAVYVFIGQWKMFVIKEALDGFTQWLWWHRSNLGLGKPRFPWIPTITPIAMSCTNGRKRMINAQEYRTADLISTSGTQSNFTKDMKRVHVAQDPVKAYMPLLARTPCVSVYDPFMGSGTLALAAIRSGKLWFGSEVSGEYINFAKERIKNECQISLL